MKKKKCAFDSGKGLGMMHKCGSGLKKKKIIKKAKKEKKTATKKSVEEECDQNMITPIDQSFKDFVAFLL